MLVLLASASVVRMECQILKYDLNLSSGIVVGEYFIPGWVFLDITWLEFNQMFQVTE
jgi:hypothetical protein